MEFIVEDFKGRYYKINAVNDCSENEGGWWCMVYRALGIGNNPYDYGEMEYEDEYSTDFCVHPEDCNCEDEIEVEQYIQSLFYEEDSFHDLIYTEDALKMLSDTDNDEFDINNECENQKDMNIEILKGKYNKAENDFSEAKAKFHNSLIELMRALLEKYGGRIEWNDDEDFQEELAYSVGTPTISYDGGNHPEYASNAFSEVYGAFLEDGEIYIICEDCDEYHIDRIWSVDEKSLIVDTILAYDEFMEEKKDNPTEEE